MALMFTEIDTLNEGVTYESYLLNEYTIQEIRAALRAGPVLLRFTKKTNGARRNMYCTLKMDMIPRSDWPKGTGSPSKDPNHIRVWDLVKKAWRSFIVQNIHPGKFKGGDIGFLDKVGMKAGFARDGAFEAPKKIPKPAPKPEPEPEPEEEDEIELEDVPADLPQPQDPLDDPDLQDDDEEIDPEDKPKKRPFSSFMNWLRGRK